MEEIIGFKDIQKELLPLLIEINDICEKNNIKYMLCGGSTLGAVRHKGFIPWDDDIDIMVPRNEYYKLLNCLNNIPNRAILDYSINNNYLYPFAKYCNTDTILIEENLNNNFELGLFLDIFPVDGVGNDLKKAKRHIKLISKYRFLYSLAHCKKCSVSRNKIYYFFKFIFFKFSKLIGQEYFTKKIIKLALKYDYEKSKYAGNLVWGNGFKVIMDKNIFENTIDAVFEGNKVKIPENYNEYLTSSYGDYMTLPPIEKRASVHSFKVFKK